MAAQVISGIGFLGAGSILVLRQQVVRGLTTAAGIWSVAAVGLAVGSGLYLAAIVTTFIIVVILAIIKPLEKRLFSSTKLRSIQLSIDRNQVKLTDLESIIKDNGAEIAEISIHPQKEELTDLVRLRFYGKPTPATLITIMDHLRKLTGVIDINFKD